MMNAAPLAPDAGGFLPHPSHWGVFCARVHDGALDVRAYAGDSDPNAFADNLPPIEAFEPPITP